MFDATTSQAIKEALEKYGLDQDSPEELAARIKDEWGVAVTPADIVSMKARLRQGLEKPRSKYPGGPEQDHDS
jgi:hypothetical protein